MQQHQFESFEAALAYLNERGTPTYWGWIGQLEGYYLYTFVAQTGIKYTLAVYKNGKVEIRE
jgi:hypothetical protein